MFKTMARLLAATAGKASTPVSIRDPAHWRNREDGVSYVSAAAAFKISAVWACVNLLAGTMASLPLMVYRTNADGSRDVASDHPLYRVLHDSPNSLQTALDFWEFMGASVELWGNAYARKLKSGTRIAGLQPIMPDAPMVELLGNGLLLYRWTQDGRTWELTSDDVLHIRGFGGNPLGGMSTLTFGARAFSLASSMDTASHNTFMNGMRPAGVLTFEKFLSQDQRDALEDKLQEKYLGAMKVGKPLVLEGGTKWEQLGINPADAQLIESRGFSIEEICRFFSVPPFMIGHTSEGSTKWGTGVSEEILAFQKFTLRKRVKRIEQALMKQLLTPDDFARGIVVEFNMEGLLRGDSQGRATFYRQMSQIGAMTINEIRQLENLPPVDGGDVPRMQSQNIPINAPPPAPAPALPAPKG